MAKSVGACDPRLQRVTIVAERKWIRMLADRPRRPASSPGLGNTPPPAEGTTHEDHCHRCINIAATRSHRGIGCLCFVRQAKLISDFPKFSLNTTRNRPYKSLVPFHPEGVSRSSQRGTGLRWTLTRRRRALPPAYGEVVWAGRPGAGIKFRGKQTFLRNDGGNKAGHRGELV
jgi:hypothetical protein